MYLFVKKMNITKLNEVTKRRQEMCNYCISIIVTKVTIGNIQQNLTILESDNPYFHINPFSSPKTYHVLPAIMSQNGVL